MDYNKITDLSKQNTENKCKSTHMLIDLKYDIKFLVNIDLKYDIKFLVNDEQYVAIESLIDKYIEKIREE